MFDHKMHYLLMQDVTLCRFEHYLHDPYDKLTSIYWVNIEDDDQDLCGTRISYIDAMHIGFNSYNFLRPFTFVKRH